MQNAAGMVTRGVLFSFSVGTCGSRSLLEVVLQRLHFQIAGLQRLDGKRCRFRAGAPSSGRGTAAPPPEGP